MALSDIRRGTTRTLSLPYPMRGKADVALNVIGTIAMLFATVSIALEAHAFWSRPSWADEVITLRITSARSWSHLLAGIRLGLDATPPIYTGAGRLMLLLGLPSEWLPLAFRSLNAVILSISVAALYRIARVYLARREAVLVVAIFALLNVNRFVGLSLDIRTYALFFAVAVVATHTCSRFLARPTMVRGLAHAASLCLLTFTHTFGVMFTVCLTGSAVLVHLFSRDHRAAVWQCVLALPAALVFLAWSPVMLSQARLGSWIDRPTSYDLLTTTFIYPASAAYLVSAGSVLLALAWHGRRRGIFHAVVSSLRPHTSEGDRCKIFLLMLIGSFFAATLTVWIESRLMFPVFLMRYFVPNVLILFVLLVVLIWSATILLGSAASLYFVTGLVAAAAMLHAIDHAPPKQPPVFCYDPVQKRFFEDQIRSDLPLVIPQWLAWAPRIDRPGNRSLTLLDAPFQDGRTLPARDRRSAFEAAYLRNFVEWSSLLSSTDLDRLSRLKSGFLVLDYDNRGEWSDRVQGDRRFSSALLASETIGGDVCRIWRVTTTIPPSGPGPAPTIGQPGLSQAYRPRGAPDPSGTARPELPRDPAQTLDHRPRQDAAPLSLLPSAETNDNAMELMTQ